MEKGYDSECYNLAEHFLDDDETVPPDRKEEMLKLLAQEIQDTVESFIYQSMPHLLAPKGG
jgi:hypothetical protein